MPEYVAYVRVSTPRQGVSGLGLEAQRRAVAECSARFNGSIIDTFEEIETGKRNDRPALMLAIKRCRDTGATLIIAKLDRLSRNVAFIAALQDSGIRFIAADMPDADETTIHIFASIAQRERKLISARTREGLASIMAHIEADGYHISKAGRRITKLGNDSDCDRKPHIATQTRIDRAKAFAAHHGPDILMLRHHGMTLRKIATLYNSKRVPGPRERSQWSAETVRKVLERIGEPTY